MFEIARFESGFVKREANQPNGVGAGPAMPARNPSWAILLFGENACGHLRLVVPISDSQRFVKEQTVRRPDSCRSAERDATDRQVRGYRYPSGTDS